MDQGFFQGGTFVFDGPSTVFAHFDASTGAHSDISKVVDLATQRTTLRKIPKVPYT
jgi:hypothetical protein